MSIFLYEPSNNLFLILLPASQSGALFKKAKVALIPHIRVFQVNLTFHFRFFLLIPDISTDFPHFLRNCEVQEIIEVRDRNLWS